MKLEVKSDARGILVEVFKNSGFGQVHYITSKPGVTRGKHYHTRKTEEFCVIQGEAELKLKNLSTGSVIVHRLSGINPELISVPKNTVHDLKNIGDTDMLCLVWNSEVFDPKDPDTIAYIECNECKKQITDEDYHTFGALCKECRLRGWSDI